MKEEEKGLSTIVKVVTRWIVGFILLFGIYIVIFGHLTPGGGFPGGVIIAGVFVLLTLSFGREVPLRKLNSTLASELDSFGALVFLLVGILGLYLATYFAQNFITTFPQQYFRPFSAGVIPICNLAIGLKVGASIFMVFIILAVTRVISVGEGRMKMLRKRTGRRRRK
ncbi:hypothetical protein J7K56_00575 [Candidatus Calescamantes bacterium]|nr:hypothetical protein [Candidatus Calescamantes bacterium]